MKLEPNGVGRERSARQPRPFDRALARLRVDSRKFTVARLAPKKYGDHISHNVKGAGSNNFQPQILIQCSTLVRSRNTLTFRLHPKQLVAFRSKATEILYRGAAGGGNPHLMRAAVIRTLAMCYPGLVEAH